MLSKPNPMHRRILAAALSVGVLFALVAAPADAAKKSTKKKSAKVTTTTAAPAPVVTEAPPTTAAPKPLFSIGKSELGDILVTTAGLSLYNFDPDARKPGGSVCNGTCADVWPPLIVKSEADLVGPSGFSGKLTTVKRDDGSLQAAVNGWPLYGWVFDKKPGDLNGQAFNEVWWVLDPAGNVNRSAPTIRFRSNKLGAAATNTSMMVGPTGGTLYMYEPDKKIGVSTCYDQCATAWPPLLVSSPSDLKFLQSQGVNKSKVTTFRRADTNQLQVAYDGWPLYFYAGDSSAGSSNGAAIANWSLAGK